MPSSYDVYGVGNSLVDIQARIDESVLEQLQFPKGIMTLVDEPTQTIPRFGSPAKHIRSCVSGPTA